MISWRVLFWPLQLKGCEVDGCGVMKYSGLLVHYPGECRDSVFLRLPNRSFVDVSLWISLLIDKAAAKPKKDHGLKNIVDYQEMQQGLK